MDRIATLFDEHRRLVAIVVIGMTVAAILGATRIEFDANMRNLFRSDDRRMEVLESIYADFGTNDNDCLVVNHGEDFLHTGDVAIDVAAIVEIDEREQVVEDDVA